MKSRRKCPMCESAMSVYATLPVGEHTVVRSVKCLNPDCDYRLTIKSVDVEVRERTRRGGISRIIHQLFLQPHTTTTGSDNGDTCHDCG